jgi:hypothetical protein
MNVGNAERILSAIAGGALMLRGFSSLSIGGLVTGILGGSLLYRGLTGHCHVYEALNLSTAEGPMGAGQRCCGSDFESSSEGIESTAMQSESPRSYPSSGSSPPLETLGSKMPLRSPDRPSDLTPGSPPQGRT